MRATPSTAHGGDRRWVRLETVLDRVRPGETVTVEALASRTGLETESVETVLRALTRAEIFLYLGRSTFVRESLLDRALEKRAFSTQ